MYGGSPPAPVGDPPISADPPAQIAASAPASAVGFGFTVKIMESEPHPKNLLLVGTGINFIDMEGAEFLLHLAKEREQAGGHLYFYGMKEGICGHLKFLEYILEIGVDNIFSSKDEAIAGIYKRLDRTVCDRCEVRIFLECREK
mgnify:CR=1 FL=1